MDLNWWVLFVFFAYFATLIGISVVRTSRMQDMSDYVLGGRRLSALTSALSAGSSMTSGWTTLAFPALVFINGGTELWTMVSLVAGFWVAWTYLAKRLRRYTIAAENSLTLPEFYEKRFDDRTGTLRTISALIMVLFIVLYISSGLIAGSKLLHTVFGLDATAGVLVTLFAVTSYTFIGGFLAVSRTDVFQALIMLAGFFILPVTLLFIVDAPFADLMANPEKLNPLALATGPDALAFILTIPGWALLVIGTPRMLHRFMAIVGEDKIAVSRNISVTWVTLIFSFGLMLGLLALPALSESGNLATVLEDPELVYLVVATVFFHPIIAGLLLTGVIAAVMSTADSQLILASAIATDDVPLIRKFAESLGSRGRVWLGRFLLVVIGGIATVFSIFNPDSVFNLVIYGASGLGTAFGPVTILALYWRRMNAWGAVASVVAGMAATVLWQSLGGGPGGIWDIVPAMPGYIGAIGAAVAVTYLTAPPPPHVVELFDRVNPKVEAAGG